MSGLLLVFYLRIGDGGVTYRTPVDDAGAFVNPAFFVHFTEHFGNGFVTALVHGETLAVPVTGGA